MGDWFIQGPDTRAESKSKMEYLLINCYIPITVPDTGKRMMSQLDLTLALMRLTVEWEVEPIKKKKLQVLDGAGCHGNTEAAPDPVAGT